MLQVLRTALTTASILILFDIQAGKISGQPVQLKDYVVDLLVVGDKLWYKRFSDWVESTRQLGEVPKLANEYICLLIHGVNAYYTTLNTLPFTIRFHVVGIRLDEDVLGYTVDPSSISISMRSFSEWVKAKKVHPPAYDHALLLTRRRWLSTGTSHLVGGGAHTSHMCNASGFSITAVTDNITLAKTTAIIAHELGHSLGAAHDTGAGCVELPYIMATGSETYEGLENSTDRWRFSPCSIRKIQDFVINLTSVDSCLTTRAQPHVDFLATARTIPGQVYSAQDQCRMVVDRRAVVLQDWYNVSILANICTKMLCFLDLSQWEIFAAEGTSCGNKMWCVLGKCRFSVKAPEIDVNKECPFDEYGSFHGVGCDLYLERVDSSMCYSKNFLFNFCCQTCQTRRTNRQSCLYGDKMRGCTVGRCFHMEYFEDERSYDQECCQTCDRHVHSLNLTKPAPNTAGLKRLRILEGPPDVGCTDPPVDCLFVVWYNDSQQCYNQNVSKQCCATCARYKTSIRGCRFGDRKSHNYCSLSRDSRICAKDRVNCCLTCHNVPSLTTTTTKRTTTTGKRKASGSKSMIPGPGLLLAVLVYTLQLLPLFPFCSKELVV